jgi:hypothetical protein
MKKALFSIFQSLLLSGLLLTTPFIFQSGFAIPSNNAHQHTCGIVGHPQFVVNGTVTWTSSSATWQNGNLQNPDGTCHQHHDSDSFHDLSASDAPNPAPGDYLRKYSPYAVWDNRERREDDDGEFDVGHGFINEAATNDIPRYRFVDDARKWGESEKALVDDAFSAWSSINSDRPDLVTGIAFQRVDSGSAEIEVSWVTMDGEGGDYAATTLLPLPIHVRFDVDEKWFFQKNPAGIGNDEIHFYTIALHEIGHVAGLDEQYGPVGNERADNNDIMMGLLEPGPPPSGGPWFMAIDQESIDGIRDLYSIPASYTTTPPPQPWWLWLIIIVAVVGIVTTVTVVLVLRARRRKPPVTPLPPQAEPSLPLPPPPPPPLPPPPPPTSIT